MSRHIIFNGDLVRNEPVFSADHELMQGSNRMFLQWFVVSSALPFYQDEFRKLAYYADKKGIILPQLLTANVFAREIHHLFQMNRIYQGGLLKMCLFSSMPGKEAQYLMTAEEIDRQRFILNPQGLKMDVFRTNRLFSGSAEVYDVGVSATETSAQNIMYERDLDQMVLLNEWNHVARFVGANFMMLKDDAVYTPDVKEGAINDVMREKAIEACIKLRLKIFDDVIVKPEDLRTADEVFVLDPVSGLRWVLGYYDKRYYHRLAPKLHETLNQLYFGKVNS